ncbi:MULTISPECIES: bis-aminopropyl spermidine synthase family protein [unclassified Clostridium]|uniref:bis-aminopropyl spermidine synthase family protein n=1 Tax=unclassified Clostridium TaxID=2614128 RepID=UPI000ECBBDD7|nr:MULTISPECIES: bis-aminopropyl spermidine synthase family protein [unclassified Clostridium]HCQ90551.1 putative methyltransferase [Clostridium sp.]
MENYLETVNKNVNIDEGIQAITNTLINIYFKEGISTKELARKNFLPIPVITAIKKELIKCDLVVQDRGVRLTRKGRGFVEQNLGFYGLNIELYTKLFSESWKDIKEINEVKKALNEIFINRPQADVTIDQSKCTVDTAIKRAVLCLRNSALIGKRILCIGDDDLVSIALGFLLKKLFNDIRYSKTKIFVMDIDNRILDYISSIAKKEELPINCEYVDLRSPLSESFKGQFDCFFTDPPYTLQGMNLFLSRGLEALKNESGLNIFLSYAHKSPEFELNMQKYFVDMGLMVSEILTAFNDYDGAEIIGNIGQMIILKTTSSSKSLIENCYQEPIYTGELKVTVRFYKCKECGEIMKVGFSERFNTIEELKEKGCYKCNNKVFQLIEKRKA